jgi:hypothetical protein
MIAVLLFPILMAVHFNFPMAEKEDVSIPDIEADVFNDILT